MRLVKSSADAGIPPRVNPPKINRIYFEWVLEQGEDPRLEDKSPQEWMDTLDEIMYAVYNVIGGGPVHMEVQTPINNPTKEQPNQ